MPLRHPPLHLALPVLPQVAGRGSAAQRPKRTHGTLGEPFIPRVPVFPTSSRHENMRPLRVRSSPPLVGSGLHSLLRDRACSALLLPHDQLGLVTTFESKSGQLQPMIQC